MTLYNRSSSAQVIYSLNALSEALFELMSEHDFCKITVTAICDKAKITRKTFYRNCVEKTDLIDYVIDKNMAELMFGTDWSCSDPLCMYNRFFDFWYKRKNLLSSLYDSGMFYRFYRSFISYSLNSKYDFLESFIAQNKGAYALKKYHNAFISGGLCEVLEQWTEEGFSTPISELVSVMLHLVPHHS